MRTKTAAFVLGLLLALVVPVAAIDVPQSRKEFVQVVSEEGEDADCPKLK